MVIITEAESLLTYRSNYVLKLLQCDLKVSYSFTNRLLQFFGKKYTITHGGFQVTMIPGLGKTDEKIIRCE